MRQTELARLVGLTAASSISHLEQGLRLPSLRTFCRLAEALSVSPDFLLGWSDDLA